MILGARRFLSVTLEDVGKPSYFLNLKNISIKEMIGFALIWIRFLDLFCVIFINKKEVKELIDLTGFSNSMIQVYKKRMYLAGILDLSTRGEIDFSLPRLEEFVKFQKALEE